MPEIPVDTTAPVLVTGATGYVAGWLVRDLLDAGVTVHAAIRNPDDPTKTAPLQAMADAAPGTIRFFRADLLQDGAYAEAMKGCRIVFHTASPFSTSVKDPQRELVDPAVKGTRNVLEEASRTPSVERVVLTSSCAAIYADATDCARASGGKLSEEDWNTTASLDYQPYSYSKTEAERTAWDIAEAQSQWRLVTVNPSLVLGPASHGTPTSESFSIIKRMGDGSFRSGVPRLGIGVVDARDVAQAHIAAGFLPDVQGRYIVSAHDTDLLTVAQALHATYGDRYPIPSKPLPKWLVWLVGPFRGLSRRFVANNVDVPWHIDNSKGKRELGLTYRPLDVTVREMFAQMIEAGTFPET